MSKKLVLLATDRYSININDFYMFYRQTEHKIVAFLYHKNCPDKIWWKKNAFKDPARDNVYDKINFEELNLIEWSDKKDLEFKINQIEFDYICTGNGNDIEQQYLIDKIGIEKFLFSEYGWLPWSKNFFISRKGVGALSEIADYTEEDLKGIEIRQKEIENLRNKFTDGMFITIEDFIYVPLQKDVNDFKFSFTEFKNNIDFLDFVHEIVPNNIKILVKEHPLYRKKYNYKKYGRFIDISGRNFRKSDIYRKMLGMVCINSTSIIEALLYGGNIFAYGKDIFLNKNIVNYCINSPTEFQTKLNHPANHKTIEEFISLLLERQISRVECIRNNSQYINNHYWNSTI